MAEQNSVTVGVRGISLSGNLLKLIFQYLSILGPFSKMRPQENELVGWFIYYYLDNGGNFKREQDLWKYVFSPEVKREIMASMGIKQHTIHNLLTRVRKRGVIVDNVIQESYIPRFDGGSFRIVINFTID